MTSPDITPVLEHYGISVPSRAAGWINVKCPFHGADRRKSGRATLEDGGAYNCMACEAKGNAITLLMQQEGLDARAAKSFYEESLGGSVPEVSGSATRKRPRALAPSQRDQQRGARTLPTRTGKRPRGGG